MEEMPCPFLEGPHSPVKPAAAAKDAEAACVMAAVLGTPPQRRPGAKRKCQEAAGLSCDSPGAPEPETPGTPWSPSI